MPPCMGGCVYGAMGPYLVITPQAQTSTQNLLRTCFDIVTSRYNINAMYFDLEPLLTLLDLIQLIQCTYAGSSSICYMLPHYY